MASIQKRNNNWRVQIRKKGQRALHATFDTRAEAEAWATAVEAAASPSTVTLP